MKLDGLVAQVLFSIEERQRAWPTASGSSHQRTLCHQ